MHKPQPVCRCFCLVILLEYCVICIVIVFKINNGFLLSAMKPNHLSAVSKSFLGLSNPIPILYPPSVSYLDIIRRHNTPPALVSVHQSSMLCDIEESVEIIQFEVSFLKLLIIPISRMDSIRDSDPSIAQVRPV